MSVISNTSPIIHLARIHRLDLLPALYQKILIPGAVWQEIVVEGIGLPGASDVAAAAWIACVSIGNRSLANSLCQDLDIGEAEAIVLALENQAELLLMDERWGRDAAAHLGIRCVGLVGMLVEAKHRKIIPSVRELLDELRDRSGFYLHNSLYQKILHDQGE